MGKILLILPQFVKDGLKRLYFWYAFWIYKITKKAPYPKTIIIDPSNVCNLQCPLCCNGSGSMKAEKGFMKIALFRKILKEIPTIKHISLFNWGESFLNPKINEIIKIAKKEGISVSIHTNLSFKKTNKFWEKLVEAGPDEIESSLDGTTQTIYQKYRKNGDLKLIIENLKKIVEIKEKLGKKKPRIFWKFMVNKFNEHQIDKAREKAAELGIDFEVTTMEIGDENPDIRLNSSIQDRIKKWIPENKKYRRKQYLGKYQTPLFKKKCDQLFTTLAISPSGKVLPCCWVSDDENAFGDISKESFSEIWNNEKYQKARGLFLGKKSSGENFLICEKCKNFKQGGLFGFKSVILILCGLILGAWGIFHNYAINEQAEYSSKFDSEIILTEIKLKEIAKEVDNLKREGVFVREVEEIQNDLRSLEEASFRLSDIFTKYENDFSVQYYPLKDDSVDRAIYASWQTPLSIERMVRSFEEILYDKEGLNDEKIELAARNIRIVQGQIDKIFKR